MVRGKRQKQPSAFYHVFNRGVEKRSIFLDEEDRETFLRIVNYAYKKYSFKIHAYCLMGNHYHFLLETLNDDLSKIMHDIDGIYAQVFNNKYSRVGPLFQDRFRSIIVLGNFYLVNLFYYIHINPVKDGFVDSVEQWRWSSIHSYIRGSSRESFLEIELIKRKLQEMGHNLATIPYFINKMSSLDWLDIDELDNIAVYSNDYPIDFSTDDSKLIRTNFLKFNFENEILEFVSRSTLDCKNKRNMAIFLLRKFTILSHDQIGKLFPDISVSSITKTSNRILQKIKSQNEYRVLYKDFLKKCPILPPTPIGTN